jgi:hypothetical protein
LVYILVIFVIDLAMSSSSLGNVSLLLHLMVLLEYPLRHAEGAVRWAHT